MQIKLWIKIHQNDKVQNDFKNVSKIWRPNETKNNNTSSQMLLDHCYAFGLLLHFSGLKKIWSSLKKETPWSNLARPGSAPGQIWPKNNNTCKGPWVLHSYQVSSKSIKRFWRRSLKCKLSNGRRTDGQTTDDGQRVITIGHWSLRLLCPKK